MELFVSDLDGTLLNSRQKISGKTACILNELLNAGLRFSFATARPPEFLSEIIPEVNFTLPAIFHNGAFVYDFKNNKYLIEHMIKPDIVKNILLMLEKRNLSPLIYTLDGNRTKKVYYKSILNYGQDYYITSKLKLGDKRFVSVKDLNMSLEEDVFSILFIDEDHVLREVHEKISQGYDVNCNYMKDQYSGWHWLEIANKEANKKSAVLFLKSYLNAKKLICFGDNMNDLPMMEVSDDKYAVSNANSLVKKIATSVIGSNDQDGVALFLKSYFNNKTMTVINNA